MVYFRQKKVLIYSHLEKLPVLLLKHKLEETSIPFKIVNNSVFPLHTWVIGVAVLRSGKTSNCIRLILLERESNISVIKYTKD